MNKGSALLMHVGIGFVFICCALLIYDIVMTIYHQFKGVGYEWYTIKVLKEKREWWKWVLAIAVFVMPFYILFTNKPAAQEDYYQEIRYYECNYKVIANDSTEGSGVLLVTREDNHLTAEVLFTEHGFVQLRFIVEALDSFIYGDIKDGGYVEIDIESGPLDPDTLQLCDNKFYYYGKQCEWCGILLPEEYIYDDGGGNMCPTCVYKDYEYINAAGVWKCGICNDLFTISEAESNPCPWCAAHE